jgi:hypothetical protein
MFFARRSWIAKASGTSQSLIRMDLYLPETMGQLVRKAKVFAIALNGNGVCYSRKSPLETPDRSSGQHLTHAYRVNTFAALLIFFQKEVRDG